MMVTLRFSQYLWLSAIRNVFRDARHAKSCQKINVGLKISAGHTSSRARVNEGGSENQTENDADQDSLDQNSFTPTPRLLALHVGGLDDRPPLLDSAF
jgi:hypothetical protein